MLVALGLLVLVTFLPMFEARASIPMAFFHSAVRSALGLPVALAVCFVANMAVGVVTFLLMGPVVQTLRRWGWFDRKVWPLFEHTQHKLRPFVEKYGEWGLAIFIGMPIPGPGAYSGAFGAYLLGMNRRKFMVANFFGALIAGVAITAVCLLVEKGVVAPDSLIRRLIISERRLP